MSKKITTIKKYLEDRIAELREQYKDPQYDRRVVTGQIMEVTNTLDIYEEQCKEILEVVGITQERINEHVGYTERECIKFADYIWNNYEMTESIVRKWRPIDSMNAHSTESVYHSYEVTKASGESSTEKGTGISK